MTRPTDDKRNCDRLAGRLEVRLCELIERSRSNGGAEMDRTDTKILRAFRTWARLKRFGPAGAAISCLIVTAYLLADTVRPGAQ